jgi:sugar lactone lactonase YvrE
VSPRLEEPEWTCVVPAEAEVSEVPLWSGDALYWIDIFAPSLNRVSADGASRTWPLPELGGSFALCEGGRDALVAIGDGLHLLALESGELRRVAHAPYDRAHFRFNDGRCDARGRFWVGTLRERTSDMPDGSGAFWRFDRDGLHRVIEGVTIANGIAFNPSGDAMYIADSVSSEVWAFDYDLDTGAVGTRRRFAALPAGTTPDGAAVDTDGCYWVTLFGAGRILRFAPDGRLDRELRAPVSYPTMVAFGGSGLDVMYVTSARRPLSPEERAREPLAGGLFACTVGATGIAEPRFALDGIELADQGGEA